MHPVGNPRSPNRDDVTGARKVRILLADDHETVREGLKVILNGQSDMTIVASVADGRSAVDQARTLDPDVVILDISMPDMNGLQAAAALRESSPRSRILALTRHSEDSYVQQLLRAGVAGYVLKQSRATELIHAIRAVASGGHYVDASLAGRLMVLGQRRHADTAAPTTVKPAVSPREEEVLRLVAWGLSNKEIASRLGVGVKTIETHKAHAMEKLRLNNRMDVVRFALLHGWLANE